MIKHNTIKIIEMSGAIILLLSIVVCLIIHYTSKDDIENMKFKQYVPMIEDVFGIESGKIQKIYNYKNYNIDGYHIIVAYISISEETYRSIFDGVNEKYAIYTDEDMLLDETTRMYNEIGHMDVFSTAKPMAGSDIYTTRETEETVYSEIRNIIFLKSDNRHYMYLKYSSVEGLIK